MSLLSRTLAGPLPWLRKYLKAFELGFETALEYRANFLISLISAAYPIIIQTFLWSAIYGASSEEVVYGYTFRQMMAYTFLAGLVGRIVRTGFEYEIMDDVKNGRYSKFLVQPLGYFPFRMASFFGNKLPNNSIIFAILALILVALNYFWGFQLELARVAAFLAAIVLALALNFLIFYCVSAVSFWIIEIGFLFEGIRIVIILLSGGIFPLEVFGETFMKINNLLPFKYTTSYPVNILNGKIPPEQILPGLLIQLAWIAAVWALAHVLWRQGGRRYVAVGG